MLHVPAGGRGGGAMHECVCRVARPSHRIRRNGYGATFQPRAGCWGWWAWRVVALLGGYGSRHACMIDAYICVSHIGKRFRV